MIKSKYLYPLLVLLLFSVTAFTTNSDSIDHGERINATEWKIDGAHSNITFEVTHFFTPVTGQFHTFNSEVYFDPENLQESKVTVEIAVSSINTNNERRDNHLRSPDFFNAEKYPSITFKSNEIVSKGDNRFVAMGNLTIKDVTKQIEMPFTLLGVKDHPQREGVQIAGIKIDHTIDRTDFGVGVGDFAATTIVGDDVDISIALELHSTRS